MKKELPPGAEGYIEKILCYDRNSGEDSQIAGEAFGIYLKRVAEGLLGTQEQDWQAAEETVRSRLTREYLKRSAS